MQDKPFWHSKTVWTSVVSLIVAIATATGFDLDPQIVQVLLFGILGLIGINLRLAVGNKK